MNNMHCPFIDAPPLASDAVGVAAGATRTNPVEITLDGAGAAADVELVPAMAGFYGVLMPNKIIANFTDPNTSFQFQDEDNNNLVGASFPFLIAFTQNKANDSLLAICMYTTSKTANKALEVDITAGGAAGKLILNVIYHYERA